MFTIIVILICLPFVILCSLHAFHSLFCDSFKYQSIVLLVYHTVPRTLFFPSEFGRDVLNCICSQMVAAFTSYIAVWSVIMFTVQFRHGQRWCCYSERGLWGQYIPLLQSNNFWLLFEQHLHLFFASLLLDCPLNYSLKGGEGAKCSCVVLMICSWLPQNWFDRGINLWQNWLNNQLIWTIMFSYVGSMNLTFY